jgi:[NiFe] hydrogenase diaphorase moiety small subunit
MAETTFNIDELPIPFTPGQTILEAAKAAGIYIPHLCYQPEFKAHGGCKMCTVMVNGKPQTACTHKAAAEQEVEVDTPELNASRRTLVQMMFIEGNHFCPGCEKSGACQLQALAYEYEMLTPHFVELFPERNIDASHPDVLIDYNRCVLCELCVRASRDVDHKEVFAIAGRGQDARLIVNSPSGKLGDSALAVTDRAAQVCPVGAIIVKRVGFAAAPIGERMYDKNPISAEADSCEIPEAQ